MLYDPLNTLPIPQFGDFELSFLSFSQFTNYLFEITFEIVTYSWHELRQFRTYDSAMFFSSTNITELS